MIDVDFIYENYEKLLQQEQKPLYPLDLNVQSASGAFVKDENGIQYLDLTSNLDTQPFGYSFTNFANEFLIADSGLFKSNISNKLKQTFLDITGLNKVYLKSSLATCFEHASLIVNKFCTSSNKNKVLAICSSAAKNNYITGVSPDYLPLNNETLLKTVFTKNVGAVIIEPVQISEEVVFAEENYLRKVKELCDKNNALLVFDLSNISPYRCSNSVFNYNAEIKPDILILSRGIANGLPFGCICLSTKATNLVEEKQETALPLDSISNIISNRLDFDIPDNVNKISEIFVNRLETFAQKHISIGNIINNGLIITFDTDYSAYELQKRFFEKNILIEALSPSKILLRPSYITDETNIEHFASTFESILGEINLFDKID